MRNQEYKVYTDEDGYTFVKILSFHALNKKMTKKFKFLGEDVMIKKLSVADVTAIQELSKDMGEDSTDQFELLRFVIRAAVEGADELEDEDFQEFPIDELTNLSEGIIKYSGVGNKEK